MKKLLAIIAFVTVTSLSGLAIAADPAPDMVNTVNNKQQSTLPLFFH
jgi:hypothetical protein